MPTKTVGRSVESVVENEIGCLYDIALKLTDLSTALYVAGETFRYDGDNQIAVELTRRVDQLAEFITDLSLASDGALTDNRECARCGGSKRFADEDPCIECSGRGYVNTEEANG